MSDIVERLRALHVTRHPSRSVVECDEATVLEAVSTITALRAALAARDAEIEKLRTALELYREAVRIDVTMEGPRFMGSNASALKRAWDADRAALTGKPAGLDREAMPAPKEE